MIDTTSLMWFAEDHPVICAIIVLIVVFFVFAYRATKREHERKNDNGYGYYKRNQERNFNDTQDGFKFAAIFGIIVLIVLYRVFVA